MAEIDFAKLGPEPQAPAPVQAPAIGHSTDIDFSALGPGETPERKRFREEMDVFKQKLLSDEIHPAFGTPGHILNGLEGLARLGRMGVKGYEEIGSLIGPKAEKYLGTAARFLLPTDKISAAAAIAGVFGEAEGAMAKSLKELSPEIARTRVISPTKAQKAAGTLISTTTAIPERYASAVVADPSILSAQTPTVSQVSSEYSKVFNRLGVKFDTKTAQKFLNKNYIPADTEAQTLNKKVFGIITKLESGQKVPPEEAFMGRSMAAALERSNLAARNHTLKSYASGAKVALDNHLEQVGVPEIKDLSAKYFRAIAKDHFESMLPKNRNMSPNALRGMIMLKLASQSAGHLARGEIVPAAGKAIQAAATSPLTMGSLIRSAGAVPNIPPMAQSMVAQAAYQAYNQNQEKSK